MSRRFSIAMVAACPLPHPRGTPIRIFRMAAALARQGHDVHVVTYHLGEPVSDIPFTLHRIANVPTYRKVSPGPTYQKLAVLDTLLWVKLAKILRTRQFDVIHAHHFEGFLVARYAPKPRPTPIVFDIHTLLESELPFYHLGLLGRTKKRLGRALDRRLPRKADHLIAVTEDIRDKLVNDHHLDAGRIAVIGNGVDLDHFATGAANGPVRAGNGSAAGDQTVIFTGNLAAYQGIDHLLDAFRLVVDARPGARLRIVSDGKFSAYAGRIDKLRLGNHIDLIEADFARLPAEIAGAAVAVNPRCECDGLPQKLLNYLAVGAPVVSFTGSAKNLIHGESAWVVPNRDIRAFADGILKLLDDRALAARLGENARRYARDNFSWDAVAQRITEVYANLCPPDAGGAT